jgi:Fe-S-cluster containining protein
MSGQEWAELTGIPMPKCNQQGCCCRGASPSVPYHVLLERASNGDDFARNFFNQFVPYNTQDEVRAIMPGLVDRTLRAAEQEDCFNGPEDVVFYKCRYIGDDNKCQVYEDRPKLCRDYPDTPFIVFAPGCAYEPWAKQVKTKFKHVQEELERMKQVQAELEAAKAQQQQMALSEELLDWVETAQSPIESLQATIPLTRLYVSSPLMSMVF